MEFLGIGPMELLFILIIALIILGPKDMAKAGKTVGSTLRKIVTSPQWRTVQQTSREMKNLPNRLIREAGLEELRNQIPDLNRVGKDLSYSIRDQSNQIIIPDGNSDLSQKTPDQPGVSAWASSQPPSADNPTNDYNLDPWITAPLPPEKNGASHAPNDQ
jgi:Sec-independent protein translocase protein TatA